ncbi:MAG TPA: hypothetical protein VK338_05190 [Candidatus Nitrosocosmicus sp.]|nr:hypothetical protein [Candidatus Nitrosocosmicus sp.]
MRNMIRRKELAGGIILPIAIYTQHTDGEDFQDRSVLEFGRPLSPDEVVAKGKQLAETYDIRYYPSICGHAAMYELANMVPPGQRGIYDLQHPTETIVDLLRDDLHTVVREEGHLIKKKVIYMRNERNVRENSEKGKNV